MGDERDSKFFDLYVSKALNMSEWGCSIQVIYFLIIKGKVETGA